MKGIVVYGSNYGTTRAYAQELARRTGWPAVDWQQAKNLADYEAVVYLGGLYAGGVQVTVRDPQFHDRSRQMQLSAPTHLIRELTAAAMDLTGQLWKPPAPVRALTVTAIHLVRSEDAYEQVDLFTAGAAPKKEKQEKLEAAMDRLRGKFGTDVISYGAARPEKEEDPLP